MRASRPLTLLLVGATLALSGCASGGDAGFCGPLHDDHETAAVAFAPLVPGVDGASDAEKRLDLVEKLEPAPGLTDELETWREYLSAAGADIDDPEAVLAAYDADAQAAGTALLDYYTGICLR